MGMTGALPVSLTKVQSKIIIFALRVITQCLIVDLAEISEISHIVLSIW